jgi:antitoxin CptB
MKSDKELLIKKLLYRSIHRGCKETDILLGNFAIARTESFDDSKLDLYQNFISEDDLEIYDWILRAKTTPKEYQSLVTEIQEFHNL